VRRGFIETTVEVVTLGSAQVYSLSTLADGNNGWNDPPAKFQRRIPAEFALVNTGELW
jgi:hypothetical protein